MYNIGPDIDGMYLFKLYFAVTCAVFYALKRDGIASVPSCWSLLICPVVGFRNALYPFYNRISPRLLCAWDLIIIIIDLPPFNFGRVVMLPGVTGNYVDL